MVDKTSTADQNPSLGIDDPIAKPELIRIFPAEDDFDADDSTIVEGMTDAPGWVYWTHQNLASESEIEATAYDWVFSEVLRINGEKLTPVQIQSAPWLKDRCYTACVAHVSKRLNKWMQPDIKLRPKPTEYGREIYRLEDSNRAIVAVDELSRQILAEYPKRSQKSPVDAIKWGLTKAFKVVDLKTSEVRQIQKADFPKFNGSIASGGDPEMTWDTWSLMSAFFLKHWFGSFLQN